LAHVAIPAGEHQGRGNAEYADLGYLHGISPLISRYLDDGERCLCGPEKTLRGTQFSLKARVIIP
jgi:hypothetical protein